MRKTGKTATRNFKPAEKLEALKDWKERGGGTRNAKRVARLYDCSIQSLYIWDKRYDGTLESLENGDKTPHVIWNKTPQEELNKLQAFLDEHRKLSFNRFLFHYRNEVGFSKSKRTLQRMLAKLNPMKREQPEKHELQKYQTPEMPGTKWQIDVKHIPSECLKKLSRSAYHFRNGQRLYQYTCVDEATRKRHIRLYNGICVEDSIDFVKRCFKEFGYLPLTIQTDNGGEFTDCFDKERRSKMRKALNSGDFSKLHKFTKLLLENKIMHELIRPATPRHNGKVERSHRTDNEEFYYNYFHDSGFDSLAHARELCDKWLYVYNNERTHSAIGDKTPQEKENELLVILKENNCKVTYQALVRNENGSTKIVEKTGCVRFLKKSDFLATN